LIERGEFMKAFSAVDYNFSEIIELPRTMRDGDGKSHVGLIPFVALLQRQSRAAFEAFAVYQSYQAWVLLRPGIEALLIVGKWVDDPANAKVWQERKENSKAYQKAYQGRALRSNSLPSSAEIQGVLSRINDDFVHANPDYYERHFNVAADDPGYVNFWLDYFDEDSLQEAHTLAFLHLLLVMQEALAGLFSGLFTVPVALKSPLGLFNSTFAARMRDVASRSAESAKVLEQLGLVALDGSSHT